MAPGTPRNETVGRGAVYLAEGQNEEESRGLPSPGRREPGMNSGAPRWRQAVVSKGLEAGEQSEVGR